MTDNLAFVRTVDVMGIRENAKHTDLSDILPEEVSSSTKVGVIQNTSVSDPGCFISLVFCSAVDRQRFEADSDSYPDSTSILIPIRILRQVLHMLVNRYFFIQCSANLDYFTWWSAALV